MKYICKSILILLTTIFIAGCATEEMILPKSEFVISFIRDGSSVASAGMNYYVINKSKGDFFTLYDGNPGSIWGEVGAKGIDFNKADSMKISYANAGKYKLSLVVTSAGNYGKDTIRVIKSEDITVVDQRSQFSNFSLNINGNDVLGKITTDNQIQFAVPDNTTNYNYVATFTLNSPLATVAVNSISQVSGKTSNNFGSPVIYTITSAQGDVNNYTVIFTTFPASAEKILTKFQLAPKSSGYDYSNGESAVIDETNKIINLALNYASNTKGPKLTIESSPFSSVLINGIPYSVSKNYVLTSITSVKVIAQDGSSATYTMNITLQNPILTFTFAGLIPAPVGIIDAAAKTVTVNVLSGTDITKLVALWTGSLDVTKIGSVVQTSGITVNDFTNPVTYDFYKGTAIGDSYKVIVNVK